MNYYTKKDLTAKLKDTTNYLELNSDGQGSIIISEYGGRPLGVFPDDQSVNLLWVNPDLKTQIYTSSRDIGGDRYWVSPERAFFYQDPEKWQGWFCPKGLDPANYKISEKSSDQCTLESPISIQNQWTKETYSGKVLRKIKRIEEPIKSGYDYCGIEFEDICTLDKPNLKANGWSLATVISGGIEAPGTVFIPTKKNPKPISYFRMIPPDRIHIGEQYVAYKIDVNDIYKLAIRPEDIDFSQKAKICYVVKLPNSENYGVLIKLSDDIPKSQLDCFDIARDHLDAEIGVIQSYNSESPNKPELRYGEIELQLSRFKTIKNESKGKSKHLLIGYVVNKEDVIELLRLYMGIQNPKFFE